jgi:hypothetical protein
MPQAYKKGVSLLFGQVGTRELRQEGSFTPLKSLPFSFQIEKF